VNLSVYLITKLKILIHSGTYVTTVPIEEQIRERTWRRWNDDSVANTDIIMQMDVSRVYLDMYMLTTKYEVSVMNIYRT
jgi:hypothetical protein